ncbi:MAG: helix-turn-helix domain-containing protein [Saccharothrix sp.]|nr:helix-turn-helix domain-containing protein [Saccharothrix sp.]
MVGQIAGWVPVATAAAQLGVSPVQVRDLAKAGQLETVKVGRSLLVSSDSVARRIAARPAPGRPLTPRAAWVVLLLASGQPVPWQVPPSEKARLGRFVRRPLDEWPRLLARRAETIRARVPEALRRRVQAQPGVALGGVGAAVRHGAGLVVSSADPVELYLTSEAYVALRGRRGIGWDSSSPNTVLRVTGGDLSLREVLSGGVVPLAVAAADLLDLGDDRSRHVAAELLRQVSRDR